MIKHFSTYGVMSVCFFSLLLGQTMVTEKGNGRNTQFTHETWTTDDGLPLNSVSNIVQTADGYLWMGTQEGLVRFDGVSFTIFNKKNTPAFKNNFITVLYVDKAGILWIGTYNGGLIKYDEGVFSHIDHVPQLLKGNVRAIFQDADETIWIALREQGVITLKDSTFSAMNTSIGMPSNEVLCFSQDLQGKVWIGTEKGIFVYYNHSVTQITVDNGLLNNTVNALRVAANGTMWIGTDDGLMNVLIDFRDKSRFLTFTHMNGVPLRSIYSIFIDRNDELWVNTSIGIVRIDQENITAVTTKDGKRFEHVASLFIDSEQNIWIGAESRGLEVLRKGLFKNFTVKDGLPSNDIRTIMEDRKHTMWIGTDRGIVKMNLNAQQTPKRYTKDEGISDNEIHSTAEDSKGRIWISTAKGIDIIDGGKLKQFLPIEKTKGLIPSNILVDSKDRVWVTTSGAGVYVFENDTAKQYTTAQGLTSNYASCLLEDFRGNIWIGTDGNGITVINDTGVTSFTTENGLTNNFIRSMYSDNDNSVWIGTFGGGLIRYAGGRFFTLTSAQGLYDDVILNIIEDDIGHLWMTTNRGIFFIDKYDAINIFYGEVKNITSTVYGKEHGLLNIENNVGAHPTAWKAYDGTLWFATTGGVAVINPNKIVVNQKPPTVVIERFLVDNQPIPFNNKFDLPADVQRIEILYTGLSFLSPKQIRFKAMLEGYDKTWYELDNRRSASYSNLPPGTYTLRIIAANSDGAWNMTGASVTFAKNGHFYNSMVFYAGVIMIGMMGMFGAYRLRIYEVRRRERKLEHLVKARTKDLEIEQEKIQNLLSVTEVQKAKAENANALKTQLIDMVTHHLKGPLASITGFAKQIEQSQSLDSDSAKYLKMIRNGSDGMAKVITNLLDLSGIESGSISFHFEKVYLEIIAGMIIDSYKFLAEKKGQTLTFEADNPETLMVLADSERMQSAIENLVSNAIKYSPYHSNIRSGVYHRNNKIRFWITDSGPGISEADQQRLFKKFQVLSATPTGGEVATGLGLAIAKEIVDSHGGVLFVESQVGNGSTFIIELNVQSE